MLRSGAMSDPIDPKDGPGASSEPDPEPSAGADQTFDAVAAVAEMEAGMAEAEAEVEMTEANLREIVLRCQQGGAEVLLLGMRMPPNYGDYAARFERVFPTIAEETGVAWVPFLLEGVGGRVELNLPDGIHPNEEGHRILAANVTPALAEMVRRMTPD